MDGLTGAIQERMRGDGSKPNSAHMMKMMNLFSIGYTVAGETQGSASNMDLHTTFPFHLFYILLYFRIIDDRGNL